MHVEAVSEGEKSQVGEKADESKNPEGDQPSEGVETAHPPPELVLEPPSTDTQHNEGVVDEPVEVPPIATTPDSAAAEKKKRRKSRSRSRGSKDLKNKLKVVTPSLPTVQATNESSQDEDTVPTNLSAPLVSPKPFRFDLMPPPIVEPGLYPPTSPSTPMLPTLEALRSGLFRSNSASSGVQRAMAMARLTGETFDPAAISTNPPPAKLSRNNTVAGGERMAARALLFHRLGERLNTDAEQTSAGEEVTAQTTTPAKRKRRRKRRSSSRASTVVDDREPSSTTPTTPVLPNSPLTVPANANQIAAASVHRPPSAPRSHTPVNIENGVEYQTPLHNRGVVIEDEDEPPEQSPSLPVGLPQTPQRTHLGRLPHVSDAPSNFSTDSTPGIGVPFFLSQQKNLLRPDAFPTSPFATPLKEKAYLEDEDDTFSEVRRVPLPTNERELSWVDPVPDRIPIHDEDDEDEDEDEEEDEVNVEDEDEGDGDDEDEAADISQQIDSSQVDTSPSPKRESVLVESEVAAETEGRTSPSPPSPSSVAAVTHFESEQTSSDPPQPRPTGVVIAPTFERVPTNGGDYSEWEETTRITTETTPKRNEGGYWERVKGAFSRSTSQNGRRSRTNSVGGRPRDNTDSSLSRESGTSLTSGKTDKDGTFAFQQSQPALQTSNSSPVSASPLPPPSSKSGPSPFPAHPTNDLLKYTDSKLFPFPGMMELEKRSKAKAMLNSASSPDISSGVDPASNGSGSSNTTGPSPELGRGRKLSHQASDTRLVTKFNIPQAPPMIANVSSSSTEYFSMPSPQSNGPTTPTHTPTLKLPTTREGVKKWLSAKKLFSSNSGSNTNTPERLELGTKSSMADLFFSKKDDLAADWEDVGSERSRGATSASGSTLKGKLSVSPATDISFRQVVDDAFGSIIPNKLGKSGDSSPHVTETPISETAPEVPSPPAPPSSATPDPQSSMDDYHSRSGSVSLSTLSSHPVIDATKSGSQESSILDLMDELLSPADSPSLPMPIEDPPRRLLLSSPVLQVVNSNTVKDRFLFLFNDILVIAKPILHDQDNLMDPSTLTVLDRRFIIKNVVQLRNLRVKTDRDDNRTQAHMSGSLKHSLTRTFVHNFAKDPDHAISTLFEKARSRDDPIGLGQLMFRTLDLDRAKLGDYLSRRTSKLVLKAYIDGFGFTGLRIDHALRIFLQSLNVPSKPTPNHNPMEFVLDAFGSRWYEANLGAVAYDKDLAVKLAKAIVQLNEVLHGGVGQEHGPTGPPLRNVIARDFISAFRRYDPRGQVLDEVLEEIYTSVRNEHLTQARVMVSGDVDIPILIKRALPTRSTYRVRSEPVILRIPQPDTDLSVHLFGQDLIFDPPVLTFSKSSEASFRITGTSLGPKRITMRRSGSNSLLYSGLPLSSSVVVERAFMRNTFQLAFSDMHCDKRKYMFSVDDPVLRHQWAASLKRQVEIASSNYGALAADPGTTKFQLAAEAVAFRVLYESLLCDEFGRNARSLSPQPQFPPTNGTIHRFDQQQRSFGAYLHARSKSRSQWYHNSMAGKMEIDLEVPIDDETDIAEGVAPPQKMWKGQDIETLCRHNSSVAGIISYLLRLRREGLNGIDGTLP